MTGAIAGDIIGSVYEGRPIKTTDFPLFGEGCRFTDDSVLTVAIAKAIVDGTSYVGAVKKIGRQYPNAGYGGTFIHWLLSESAEPYNSWGNGSAMRVSPVGFAFDSAERVLDEAARTAEITHNHPEGIKGAQAVALAVFLARKGHKKSQIRESIQSKFGYDLSRTIDQIRPSYRFDVSCQGSVPESIIAFLDSTCFEDAVRNAVSLGGDSDTMACMAGAAAEAFYGGVPGAIVNKVRSFLTDDLWEITRSFCTRFYDLSIRTLED